MDISSVSKLSSRSSTSDYSSVHNDRYMPSTTFQTVLNVQRVDINPRTMFCGEQDGRLNELRRMTGAIIDLNMVPSLRRPFERVDWTISHPNPEVRDFVVRRLYHWMQQTQIACDMAHEDVLFSHEQHEKQMKLKQPPPLTKSNFGRRYRTQSLTRSEDTCFRSRQDTLPGTPLSYQRDRPFTGLLGRTLQGRDPRLDDPERELITHRIDLVSSSRRTEDLLSNRCKNDAEMAPSEICQLMEMAKWAGALSDTSDNELNENRVCFADTVTLSKFAEILRDHELQSNSDLSEIENVLQQSTIAVTTREQIRQVEGKTYWFHRIVLDGHIQFPPGISQDAHEARKLAHRHMIEVCMNNGGVKMKVLTGNRVKVVKGLNNDHQHRRTADDLDGNATYISMDDLSCLSHCKMVY